MARIRTIKPDCFTDAEVNELPPLHRWLMPALWCQADRDGRIEDKPRELKVKCLPYDDCDVDAMLWDLHRAGFIVRYEVDGRRYLAIPGFEKHQRFHKDEKPRGLPPPPDVPQPAPDADATPAPLRHGAGPTDTKPPPAAGTVPAALVSDVLTSDVRTTEPPDAARVSAVNANDTLKDKLERIWAEKRGTPPSESWYSDAALRPAFEKARGDEAVLLRVFSSALDRSFPELIRLVDLGKNWDAYAATRPPAGRGAPGPNARATNADKWDPSYRPPVDENGDVDLLAAVKR